MTEFLHFFKGKLTNYSLTFIALFFVGFVSAQTVSTDKDDYVPGEIAIITGSGWINDQFVDLHFEEDPFVDHIHDYHDIPVNTDGTFRVEFPILERHLGVTFTLTAKGQSSALVATTNFTDGAFLFAAKGLPSNTSIVVSYTISGTGGGTGTFLTPSFIPPSTAGSTINNKTITANSYTTTTFNPNPPANGINYVILDYGLRIGNSSQPTNPQTSNSFDVEGGGGGNAALFTANYGALVSSPVTATYGSSVTLTATFYSNYQTTTGISGKTLTFYLNGTSVGTAATNSSGVATLNLNLTSVPTLGKLSVGSYNITTSFGGDSGLLAVPKENSSGSILTIDKKDITGNFTAGNKVYDANTSAAVLTRILNGVLAVDASNVSLSNGTATFVNSNVENGKTVTLAGATLTGSAAGNYNLTSLGTTTANITQRDLSVTANTSDITYGDAAPAVSVSYSGFVGGDDDSDLDDQGFTLGTDYVQYDTVGTYNTTIAQGTAADNNYNFKPLNTSTFEVVKRDITITADAGQTKIYGDSDPVLTAQVTSGVIQGTDAFSGSLLRATGEDVGTYAINKGTYTYGTNYAETYVSADLTIGTRAITITADVQSKTYGDSDPALTAQVTSGVIQGSDAASGSLLRDAGEDVGTYAINQDSYTYGSNYNETYVSADLTIGTRAITITADVQSKTYGDSDPALTAQVTSGVIQGTDAASGSLLRDAGEDVGTYAINKDSYTYGSNYNETYVSADLTIGTRAITITADAKQKFSGQIDPALTYQITNGILIGNDTFAGNLSRNPGESSGSYPINQNTVSLSNNYTLSYISANLTIDCPSTIDVSNAQNPRSITENISIDVIVQNGNTLLSGVSVKLNINGVLTAAVISVNGIATFNLGQKNADVYAVYAEVEGCLSQLVYLPVYDPNGGFVTGGGWINSPNGALVGTSTTGKANFGFNAKYKTGKNNLNEVDGNTTFQFKEGDFSFKSKSHDDMSLVISGEKKATYRGVGTVNGSGSHKFMITVIDGDAPGGDGKDKFRIKVWASNSSSNVIYDNEYGVADNGDASTVLGGGSIVIHKPKGNGKEQEGTLVKTTPIIMQEINPEILETLAASPNPVVSFSTVRFSLKEDANVVLRVYDYSGRMIETLYNGQVKAYQNYDVDFQRKNLMSGIYIVKLTTDKGQSYDKRIIVE